MPAILCLLLLDLPAIHAQQKAESCKTIRRADVAEQDRPTLADLLSAGVSLPSGPFGERKPGTAQLVPGCSGMDLYYNDGPPHFEKARFCVLAELGLFSKQVGTTDAKKAQTAAAGLTLDPSDIDGSETLTLAMLYANGERVKRNLPLARQRSR